MKNMIELHELPPPDKAELAPKRFAVDIERIQHIIDMEAETTGVVDLSQLGVTPRRFTLLGLKNDPRPIKVWETYDHMVALLSSAGADIHALQAAEDEPADGDGEPVAAGAVFADDEA